MIFGRHASHTRKDRAGALERNLPLFLAYVAGPMLAMTQRFLHPDSAWVLLAERGLWLGLAGYGLTRALVSRQSSGPLRTGLPLMAGSALIMAALSVALSWVPPRGMGLWLAEFSPLAWIGLAVLWAKTVAAPRGRDFLSAGAGLALAVLADLAVTSLLAWRPMLSGGFFFPSGLDRVELHATLLLVAFAAGVTGSVTRPEKRWERWLVGLMRGLVFLGLLATFSRTALTAAFCLILFMGRGSWNRRVQAASICLGFAAVTVILPELPGLAMERFEARLGWVGMVGTAMGYPALLLHGVGADGTLSLFLPENLVRELSLPSDVIRILPSSLTSGWLRLLAVWGAWSWLAALGAAGAMLAARVRRSSPAAVRKGVAVVVAAVFQGLLFPLPYLPAAMVPLILVLFTPETDGPERRSGALTGRD